MKRWSLNALVFLAVLTLCGMAAAYNGVPQPQLHTDSTDGYLKDANGARVVLRGLNIRAGDGTDGPTMENWITNTQYDSANAQYGVVGHFANIARVEMWPMHYENGDCCCPDGNYNQSSFESYFNNTVVPMIQDATTAGLYVELDAHFICDYTTGGPNGAPANMMPILTQMWQYVVEQPSVQNNPAVFFDLVNEPISSSGGDSWGNFKSWIQPLVTSIRGSWGATRNIIIVSAPDWATSFSGVSTNPVDGTNGGVLPWNNIVYEYHIYPHGNTDFSSSEFGSGGAELMSSNLPMIIGEFAFDTDGDGVTYGTYSQWGQPFWQYIESSTTFQKISWEPFCFDPANYPTDEIDSNWNIDGTPPAANNNSQTDGIHIFQQLQAEKDRDQPDTLNRSIGGTASASSIQNSSYPASDANDGNYGTRWSSEFSDPQWLEMDLGQNYSVSAVVLNWETAYGSAYSIQTSTDNNTWTTVYSESNGKGGVEMDRFPTTTARYVRMYGTARGTQWGYSLYEMEVYGMPLNLALNRVVSVSSVQPSTTYYGPYAVDGNTGTRWSSAYSDPQWINVDLGKVYNVNSVSITWENAYASAFQIQTSVDGVNWTTVWSTTTGTGGTQNINFTATPARYVQMYGTQRGTQYGYSIWEFDVYANASDLAADHPVTFDAEQTTSTPANTGHNGNDSDPTTRWCAGDGNTGHWWQVDLGAPHNLIGDQIMWEHAAQYLYEVQASPDGQNWTTVVNKTSNNPSSAQIQDDSYTANGMRYVRITVTGLPSGSWASFFDFNVLGN